MKLAIGYTDLKKSMLAVPESFRIGKRGSDMDTEYVIEFNASLYKIRAYETEICECPEVDIFEFSEEVEGVERLRIGALLIDIVFSKTVNQAIISEKIDMVQARFLDEVASFDDACYVKMLAEDATYKGCVGEFSDAIEDGYGVDKKALDALMKLDF